MSKIKTNPFETVLINQGDQVQVWLSTPDNPESEFICQIHVQLVPQLIAILTRFRNENHL
jgi:hypothetical protein